MYTEDDPKLIHDLLIKHFEKVSKYLGNKEWLIGKLSVADFVFAYLITVGEYFTKNALSQKYP